MSHHYYASTRAYASNFEPGKLFATEAEARSFDHGFAANVIENARGSTIAAALAGDDGDLVRKVIAFLFAELPPSCRDAAA